jgi:drug/metabolite transporter (DMT)-like permease
MVLAVVWGSTLFSTKRLISVIPVPDFLFVRFAISTLLLVAVFHRSLKMSRQLWLRGSLLGVIWSVGQLLQTAGIGLTSASIAGFVTGLYVVITPVLGLILYKLRVHPWVWVAVALSTVGLATLTIRPVEGGFGVGSGEILVALSAIAYAFHIVFLGRWSKPSDVASLTVAQGLSMTVVFFFFALPDGITLPSTGVNWAWMIYLAVMGGAVSIVVQTWAQGHMEASVAAVIMCSEPLWATFFAMLFGGERPNWLFAVGAAAILISMYLVIKPPGVKRPSVPD